MPTGINYCTRESVKAALDEAETARSNDQIDAAIETGGRQVDGLCLRPLDGFAPNLRAGRFDYPQRRGGPSWRIRFDGPTLLEAHTVTSDNGAVTIAPGDYFLEPRDEPRYDSIEINLAGSASFGEGGTHQRAISILGLWGWSNDRRAVGSLSSQLGGTDGATASLAWTTARFGIGDVLFVDDEAMVISSRSFVDSGQNLGADLDDSAAAIMVAVTDGTAYAIEEIIAIDGERMRIVEIIGNALYVLRAWDGSQLAAHTAGADVYGLTGVELTRAVLGTTIAAHSSAATVYRWIPPGPVAALNRAYALNTLLQERTGWSRTLQVSSDQQQEFNGRGIAKLERDVLALVGTGGARHRAIR